MTFLIAFLSTWALAKDASVFKSAQTDIATILTNSVFSSYSEYNITNIRQGELGESMAYFVRLEKPFNTDGKALCFIFQNGGKWAPTKKKPETCGTGHSCSCD